ncbi:MULTISPECIES: chorismate mutase [unclassified Kutzneria]|uniref:chorismate mutase n=1 Tax=unclassified Kutzneria TaxID=2621979 RepID=UPI0003EEB790|nr:chorismate mutase [Kutzneria sp. 744]EWM15643.1 chorismate mutase [Kutzneria sp. 744]MDX6330175.1 chorismate mutase [Streptomycetaceae bacterium]
MSTPVSDQPTPDIPSLREEIDHLDAEIIRLIGRRAEVSGIVGKTRMANGGTKIVHNREIDILARYREGLGPEGKDIALILLRMGRGPLGR